MHSEKQDIAVTLVQLPVKKQPHRQCLRQLGYCCTVGTPCCCAAINLNASVNVYNDKHNVFNLDIVEKFDQKMKQYLKTPPQAWPYTK